MELCDHRAGAGVALNAVQLTISRRLYEVKTQLRYSIATTACMSANLPYSARAGGMHHMLTTSISMAWSSRHVRKQAKASSRGVTVSEAHPPVLRPHCV